MRLNKENLKQSLVKLGFSWSETKPNIIGVRSALNVPNQFNDFLALIIEPCNLYPAGLERVYRITTDPGETYLLHPLNNKGTAFLKPGQYINSYALGFHQQKREHPALVQIRPVTVYRDNNKDNKADWSENQETGLFGVNIHGANKNGETLKIGPWSAGCQVFAIWQNKEDFLLVLNQFKDACKNEFTYTLIHESQLIDESANGKPNV